MTSILTVRAIAAAGALCTSRAPHMPAYSTACHPWQKHNSDGYRVAWRHALAGAVLWMAAGTCMAANFIVTASDDGNDGACTAPHCSLREAITLANNNGSTADNIRFSILVPIRGEILVQPSLPLPTILHPVVIDGYAQGGAGENTDPTVSNARLRIRLDGATAGAGANGFSVCSSNVTIQGLAITNFGTAGISFGRDQTNASCGSSFSNWVVSGNFIGLRSDGTTADGNNRGVRVLNGVARIGGSALVDRNVIAANDVHGIELGNAATSTSVIEANLIGTDKSGTLIRGNGSAGVNLAGGSIANVRVGGTSTANLIAHNVAGISVFTGAASGNTLFGNRFVSNTALGIDLGNVGVTNNDPDDADTGPNSLRNFPVITAATRVAGGLAIQGSEDIGGSAPSNFTLAFYASADCDDSGHGEGERFLGTRSETFQNAGDENFNFTLSTTDPLPPGTVITATATDSVNSTSEFSECFFLDPPALVVNTTNGGTGDDNCNAAECTLREAVAAANAMPPASLARIEFDIPGPGPHRIALPAASGLDLHRQVLIDGYTQPGARPNALADGDDAVILIEIDGTSLANSDSIVAIDGDNATLRGLALTDGSSGGNAVLIQAVADGTAVEGCFIGLSPDGDTGDAGVSGISDSGTNTRIGGTAPASRNLIAFGGTGIILDGRFARVDNNYLGTDRSGALARPNARGIVASFVGNGDNRVGTLAPNLIAFNSIGVRVGTTTRGLRLGANRIHSNSGLGIDLQPDGVSLNDTDDADTGGNDQQNFPVLDRAQRSVAGLNLAGILDVPSGTAGANYEIGVFANASCDGSGHGEGERYLGARTVSLTQTTGERFAFDLATDDPLPAGTQITATATSPDGSTSEFSACLAATDPPPGFVVTSAADTDGSTCGATCTLRQAINAANAQAGADLIRFELGGTGPFTIAPGTPLPTITEAVSIDGYTQLGASANTAEIGSNAVILIVMDGPAFNTQGFTVCANDTLIRGFSFVSFVFGRPIRVGTSCAQSPIGVRVVGNFFGLSPDGTVPPASLPGASLSIEAAAVEVGGVDKADRNLFGGGSSGISVTSAGASGTRIRGNAFGMDPTGLADRGHSNGSIQLISQTTGVTVGDVDALNQFRFSERAIVVERFASGNRLYANQFSDHNRAPIQLCPVAACSTFANGNDIDDTDSGGNNLQNSPVLTSAVASASSLTVTGNLDVPLATSNAAYTIALYENTACDVPSGNSEGEIFLGAQVVTLSGSSASAEDFSVTLAIPPPSAGRIVTSTATAPDGSTSEFSGCVTVVLAPQIFVDGFEGS